MKPLKILFVCDHSIGTNYLRQAVQYIDPKEAEITVCRLSAYPDFDHSGFDGLIYHTFPDEFHPGKFRSDLVKVTDEKFWSFKGKALLFDSHDEGSKEAFTRFKYRRDMPRIKTVPCYGDDRNIVIPIPFAVDKKLMDASQPRTIPILYCARLDGYLHNIRRQVLDVLQPFEPFTDRMALHDYIKAMKSADISVVAPGYGTACVSHLESLAAGALLLAHESIRETKLLPFFDLVPNEHYVIYNLDNLEAKIRTLLSNPHIRARIAAAGHQAFRDGYDLNRTANQVLKYFKRETD